VNCSKTIWILATNALDEKISNFCDQNEGIITSDEAGKEQLTKQLSKELKKGFLSRFGVREPPPRISPLTLTSE
jgi:hypothetical protein